MQGTVRVKLPMVPTVIMACCVLHNLAILFKMPEPDEEFNNEDSTDDEIFDEETEGINYAGHYARQKIVNQHFT